MTRLGLLHPGEMGASLAASALPAMGTVYWCSEGRSDATAARATSAGLTAVPTLTGFLAGCDIVIAVCPPHAAVAQLTAVLAAGFTGIYVDANAIAPATAREMAALCEARNVSFVDAGIVGLPTTRAGTTWLYLSGKQAMTVQACFAGGPFECVVLGEEPGQASALKLCYAGWNKGKTALFTAVLAAAESLGVRDALERQWEAHEPGMADHMETRIRQVARKAWRFDGEMLEIAAMLAECKVPEDFFTAAAQVYVRQAQYKDAQQPPALAEILARVATDDGSRDH